MNDKICFIKRNSVFKWDTIIQGPNDEISFILEQSEKETNISHIGWGWIGTSEEEIMWYPIDRKERENRVNRKIYETKEAIKSLKEELEHKKSELIRILNFQKEYEKTSKDLKNLNSKNN